MLEAKLPNKTAIKFEVNDPYMIQLMLLRNKLLNDPSSTLQTVIVENSMLGRSLCEDHFNGITGRIHRIIGRIQNPYR